MVLPAPRAAAQYAIPWFKIAGGGGMMSTGGVFTLSGTIGQVDAGRVANGLTNRIEGGFWAIAVQQAGFPPLDIQFAGTNAVVSWVSTETGFILQHAPEITAPRPAWVDLGPATSVAGTTNSVTVPHVPDLMRYFRLRRP